MGFVLTMLAPGTVHVRLVYRLGGKLFDNQVRLDRTSCRFGGWRWWFICPVSGQRVGKLHLPPGATRFAGRQVYRLAYQSNRNTELRQSHERLRRLHARLKAPYSPVEDEPPRPREGCTR